MLTNNSDYSHYDFLKDRGGDVQVKSFKISFLYIIFQQNTLLLLFLYPLFVYDETTPKQFVVTAKG